MSAVNIPANAVPNILDLTINNGNGTTYNGTTLDAVTITSGSLTLGADVTVEGNWTNAGGNFVHGSRKVTFIAGNAQTISGANDFYSVEINKTVII